MKYCIETDEVGSSIPRTLVLRTFLDCLPDEPGILVLHSSIHDLVPPQANVEFEFVFVINELVQKGWTVALPSFTFSFCTGHNFSLHESKSEVGVLADWIYLHCPEAARTKHPIYSFVVVGKRANEILHCNYSTTFGDDSPFGFFERENATICMLGCSWRFNTFFHRFEELAKVPYRFKKTFEGLVNFGDGLNHSAANMWVRDLDIDAKNNFFPAIDELAEQGCIKSLPLWRGKIEICEANAIAKVCRRQLKQDALAYVHSRAYVQKALDQKSEASSQPSLSVAVMTKTNGTLLERHFRSHLEQQLPSRNVEFFSLPFGQMEQSILDTNSILWKSNPNIRIFVDRVADVIGDSCSDLAIAQQRVRDYLQSALSLHESMGGWTIVHKFASDFVSTDFKQNLEYTSFVDSLNQLVTEETAAYPNVVVIDVNAEALNFAGKVSDPRLWYTARTPFSDGFSNYISHRWTGVVLSILGKTTRLIVVDLDNTLWAGVLGEDGIEGINIGGDYPGIAFKEFQTSLKRLSERGFTLAIASKNDEELALNALSDRDDCILKPDDFSSYRINWQPKWQNIADMASELNLGLGSVMFIDDNPVEREAVRRNLPEVTVLDLPEDPAMYCHALLQSQHLTSVKTTDEDRNRVEQYKAQTQRERVKKQSANLEDYFASLEMKLFINPLDVGNTERAAQLCQKTNQFNTTTRRYDIDELKKLASSGADVAVLGLEDKHSKYENIGLAIVIPQTEQISSIDVYLLSCRVLGRGIETVVPTWARQRVLKRGGDLITAEIVETPRNTPVRTIYKDAGFEKQSRTHWSAEGKGKPYPSWLTIVDNFEQGISK